VLARKRCERTRTRPSNTRSYRVVFDTVLAAKLAFEGLKGRVVGGVTVETELVGEWVDEEEEKELKEEEVEQATEGLDDFFGSFL